MKAENKTKPTDKSVENYLASIVEAPRRSDARALVELMSSATGTTPVMWGTAIVGFGCYHYVYETGREGDTPAVGFSARKQALVLYGLFHYENSQDSVALASRLGTHTTGKGCIYIKSLGQIDQGVLGRMIRTAYLKRNNS
jgi:Domain of unknown function (DU1801)